MECSERPWPGMSLVEVVREVDPVLPIIFVARFDPELRREARRLAVDFMVTSPPNLDVLCRAAQELAPLLPDGDTHVRH